MAKSLFKTFFRIFEFILGFVIILSLLLSIRLLNGPIQIKSLTPLIIENFTDNEKDVQVNIKDAYIELALNRGRLMDIRLDELNISDADGFVLTVQDANFSFNPFWLLVGRLALRDIELNKPYVQVNLNVKENDKTKEDNRPLGRRLNRIRRYVERLDSFNMKDAQVVLSLDENASVSLPNVNAKMSKNFLDEMDIDINGDLYFDGVFSNFNLKGFYDLSSKKMQFKSSISDFDLTKMHELSKFWKNVNFVLSATAEGILDLSLLKTGWQNIFNNINFEISTQKEASLYLPAPIDTAYQISNLLIKGKTTPHLESIELRNSRVDIMGKTAKIEASLSGLKTFFKTKNANDLSAHLNVNMSDISMMDVPYLWPSSLGMDAHSWVKENVLAGNIKKAVLDMSLEGFNLKEFSSTLDVYEAKVRYVDEMIPASDGHVKINFETNQIKMDVLSAKVGQVDVIAGYVNFLDLDKDLPRFDMAVDFKGKISDELAIVSTKPLEVCDMIEIPCQQIQGNAQGTVKLAFPFFEEGIEHFIDYSVQADFEETAFPVPKTDWKIEQGNFKFFINNKELTLKGGALLEDTPVRLDVLRSFEEDKENKSLYQVQLPLTVSMLKPYYNYIGDFFQGSLLADVTVYPQSSKETIVDVELQLKDAEISLPIGYVKELNQKGILKATLSLENDKLIKIPSLFLSIPEENISIKGYVTLPKDKMFELNLSEIKAPRTNAQMVLNVVNENTFDLVVSGNSLDISSLIHGQFWSDGKNENLTPTNFKIQGTLDTLYLADREPFKNINISLQKQDGHWRQINGYLMSTVPFKFNLNEEKTALNIQTDDVGEFLRRSGFTDRIKGGSLNSTISQNENGDLGGELFVQDYELMDTGFFMQAATLLGIVDALKGDSIAFERAIIPFTLSSFNDLEIKDAVASGTAVGFTLRGNIKSNEISFNGSVVPAYALNSLLGKIPVIGTLFSGEDGGGLIGVSYSVTGKTDNPEFSFNPASLLTPGIFRRLFDAF